MRQPVVIHVPYGLSWKLHERWYDSGDDAGYYYKPTPRSRLRMVEDAIGSVLACLRMRGRYVSERELNPYEALLYSATPGDDRPWKKRVTINGLWIDNFRRVDEHIIRCLKAIEDYGGGAR